MGRFVIANHKMYMTSSDVKKYLSRINKEVNRQVIICPTSIYIPYFLKQKFKVGIQNVFYENEGAYTGEISPRQIKSMGVSCAIVGHSERRKNFLETNSEINQKIDLCLKNNVNVILCIGETAEEKKKGLTEEVLEKEIKEDLKGIKDFGSILIAYEPMWAIGSGETPSMKEIDIYTRYIKQIVKKYYDYKDMKVAYGGSITPDNIEEISKIESLDGILVGKASTNPDEFIKITKSFLKD